MCNYATRYTEALVAPSSGVAWNLMGQVIEIYSVMSLFGVRINSGFYFIGGDCLIFFWSLVSRWRRNVFVGDRKQIMNASSL